jgi:putative FmdB family regulatory protein
MPIYEYICHKCDAVEEVLQKIGDDAPARCPACGALGSLSKAVSNSAFHLKGGGWYKDLYSSPKPSEKSDDKNVKVSKKTKDKKDS